MKKEIISALVLMTVLLATFFIDLWEGPVMDVIQGMALGVGYGMIVIGVIMTSRYSRQIREFKLRLLNRTGKKDE